MQPIERNVHNTKDNFVFKRIYPNENPIKCTDNEFCPECGDFLRPEGRCRYCACCGWSSC